MIIIHYDYTDGTELSYKEGIDKCDNFSTCCLEFFNQTIKKQNVVILCKDGKYISKNGILLNNGKYTSKEIRAEHDILKIFLAKGFLWQEKDGCILEYDKVLYQTSNKNKINKVNIRNLNSALKLSSIHLSVNDIDNIIDLVELIEEKGDDVSFKNIYDLQKSWE